MSGMRSSPALSESLCKNVNGYNCSSQDMTNVRSFSFDVSIATHWPSAGTGSRIDVHSTIDRN